MIRGMKRPALWWVALACVIAGQAASAEDFYCGDKVISTGMTPGEVVAACGKPADVHVNPPVRHRHGYGHDSFEEIIEPGSEVWTFNFGATRLMERVVFVGGVVTETTALGRYGY
jgi:hypothetical protein